MDYIRFHCPNCNHLLVVPPEAAGMSGPCPNCRIIIQGPNQPPAPQPQPLNPPREEVPVTLPHPQAAPEPVPILEPVISPPFPAERSQEIPPSQEYAAPAIEQFEASPIPEEKAFSDPLLDTVKEESSKPEQEDSRRLRGLSFLQAFLLCFIFSLIFFVLGFFLGKSGSISWDELGQISRNLKKDETSSTTPPNKDPEENEGGKIAINPLAEKSTETNTEIDASTAQATLEAFLAADTWGARNAYVLNSKSVLSMMAANASIHGDGPIAFEGLGLQSEHPNTKVFWIQSSKHSLPFTIAMVKEGEWWLVDWLGFADFYYDRLDSFAKGREGPMTGTFRVLLKAAPGETSPLSPARCLVSSPQLQESYQVNSATESPARRKLAEIFQAYLQGDPDNFKKAMAGEGIPLIVEISRTGAVNPTLQLVQIMTTGWPPLPPEQIKKEAVSSFY